MNTNNSEDELIIEVDSEDRDIGVAPRKVLHADRNRYHRSTAIFVFNSKGEIIYHQRSAMKAGNPLKWAVFGGHQKAGQGIEEAAKSELQEELGISAKLTFIKKILVRREKQSEFKYAYKCISDGPYSFDPAEVVQIAALDPQKVMRGEYNDRYEFTAHGVQFLKDTFSSQS